jgi:hypothetical protein
LLEQRTGSLYLSLIFFESNNDIKRGEAAQLRYSWHGQKQQETAICVARPIDILLIAMRICDNDFS